MRCCISVKLSPPGKRNVDGARWTVCHSGSFISVSSSRTGPVAEVALEQAALDLRPHARGARRSVRPSREHARAVRRRRHRRGRARPMRSAAARRLRLTGVGEMQPAARPGRILPVVGVWPWRTNRNMRRRGGLLRCRHGSDAQPNVEGMVRPGSCRGARRRSSEVIDCRRCPRLVEWREQVAVEKRAAFRDECYWGRPVPGFGDPQARIVVLGLAPAAHGANRTGRVFTGDRSGDFLFAGDASGGSGEPADVACTPATACASTVRGSRRREVRPAGQRTNTERTRRVPPFLRRELRCARAGGGRVPRRVRLRRGVPALRHPAATTVRPRPSRCRASRGCSRSFHPSQQNTFTGRLTADMLDAVFTRAIELTG